jgi:hypothetical protein
MRIYLASRYSRREELCVYRATLEAEGHTVTSRWLNGNHQIDDQGLSVEGVENERTRFALEDWEDLMAAECCIGFTEPARSVANSRGGRHVEFGGAIAAGKDCIVVGPRENVFHCLPQVRRFATWEEFLARPFDIAPKGSGRVKVTITIQDGEKANEVKLSMDFAVKPNDKCTPAQQFAFHVMAKAQEGMGG